MQFEVKTSDGVTLGVDTDGPAGAPPLLLSNSLGTTMSMWEPQLATLGRKYRIARYDTRGHGSSGAPPGNYSIERLGRDVLEIADALGWNQFDFAGVSMGGMTGLWLASHAPERLRRVVVANGAPFAGGAGIWGERMKLVREQGMAGITDMVLSRWFTPGFAQRRPEVVERVAAGFRATSATGYLGCCAALRDMDLRPELAGIGVPVLVIGGAHDGTPSPAQVKQIAAAIPGASAVILEAAHLSNIEDAAGFDAAVTTFLA